MQIDQAWVIENIDLIMRRFVLIHPEFDKKDNSSRAAKSRHRRKIMKDCNTISYRPLYYIAKHQRDEDRLWKIIKTERDEIKTLKIHLNALMSKLESIEGRLEEEFGRKSFEYQTAFP